VTFTERLKSWETAAKDREHKRRLQRANRTPRQKRIARLIGAAYWGFVASIILFAVGGLKGAAFLAKVLFVALHITAFMDVDLDAGDRSAAVNGMLQALDKNSGTLSQRTVDNVMQGSEAKRVSFGWLLSSEGSPIISAIQDGSPVQTAGLKVGDEIVGIGEKDAPEDSRNTRLILQVIDRFAEEGKTVPISVRRGPDILSVDVTMTPWSPRAAYGLGVQDGVAHVAIPQFRSGVAEDVAHILEQYMTDGPVSAVMIDLRGNPGGLMKEKTDLASLFLPKGTPIAKVEGRRAFRKTFKTTEAQRFPDISRVGVIIDGNSASASEGFAALVQDLDLGPVIGETSYGKGSQQIVVSLNGGIEPFRLTLSRFTGPKGTPIDGVGIVPDIALDRDTDEHPKWVELISQLRRELARPH